RQRETDRLSVDKEVSFFFQAEDGIRDRTVTGVQTCALPISIGREAVETYESALERLKPEEREAIIGRVELGYSYEELAGTLDKRSEERRVGKECRSL